MYIFITIDNSRFAELNTILGHGHKKNVIIFFR